MSAPSGVDFLAAKAEEVRRRQAGGAGEAGADGPGPTTRWRSRPGAVTSRPRHRSPKPSGR
jgi:hypothetical protein